LEEPGHSTSHVQNVSKKDGLIITMDRRHGTKHGTGNPNREQHPEVYDRLIKLIVLQNA
jgi:hypothetical protein